MTVRGYKLCLAVLAVLPFCCGPAVSATAEKPPKESQAQPPAANKAPQAAEEPQTPYEKRYYADPFYRELSTAAIDKTARDLLDFMNRSIEEKPERIHPSSLWLRDNSIGQRDLTKVDALYFLSYSDVMGELAGAYAKAGDKDSALSMTKTALMALYVYELMASIDAERCSDPTVLEAMRTLLFSRYDHFKDAFRELSKSDFDLFATNAFIADRKFEKRPANEYICSMGQAKRNDELRQAGTRTQQIDDPSRPGLPATEILPPKGYHFTPGYVDDTEWGKRRVSMREQVRKLWEDRYERLSKVGVDVDLHVHPDVVVPAPHPAPEAP